MGSLSQFQTSDLVIPLFNYRSDFEVVKSFLQLRRWVNEKLRDKIVPVRSLDLVNVMMDELSQLNKFPLK